MGMTAAALAARCGFADCSLYLQRVAEQQHLKASGMINGTSLPIIPHQEVLPGQKPDKGFILQGLNGGQLPNVIDSENHSNDFHSEMDHHTYMHNNINGFHQKHDLCVPQCNGLLDGYTEHQNAINGNHNFLANCQSLCDTQGNHMFSAGRKRRLDGCIEPYDEFKRIRQHGDGQNPVPLVSATIDTLGCNFTTDNGLCHNTSSDEHVTSVRLQQGYNCLFIDSLLQQYHGS